MTKGVKVYMTNRNFSSKSTKKAFAMKLGVSAGLLASVLSMTDKPVQAEGETPVIDEIKSLQQQFNQVEQSSPNNQEVAGNQQEAENQQIQQNGESEEVAIIKQQLVQVIEKVGGPQLVSQLHIEELSTEELDNVFEAIITYQEENIAQESLGNTESEAEQNQDSQADSKAEEGNSTDLGQESAVDSEQQSPQEDKQISEADTDEESATEESENVAEEEQTSEETTENTEESSNEEESSQEETTEESENVAEEEQTSEETADNKEESSNEEEASEEETSEEPATEESEDVAEEEQTSEETADNKEESSNEEEASEEETSEEPATEESEDVAEEEQASEETADNKEESSNEEEASEEETSEESATEESEDVAEEEQASEETTENTDGNQSDKVTEVDSNQQIEVVPNQDEQIQKVEVINSGEQSSSNGEENSEAEETPKVSLFSATSASIDENSSEELIAHTVQAGDTVNKIASQYDTTPALIADYNNLADPTLIYVGDVLNINQPKVGPGSSTKTDEEASEQVPTDISAPTTNSGFVNEVGPYASYIAEENNLYASVMIAQASLESGYGSSSLSTPPNHNLFGIKGKYNGESVAMYTKEYYSNSGWVTIVDHFKKYPNYAASFQDNANLIRGGLNWNSQYYAGAWRENTNSYKDATGWLEGRYATDPTYADKLNNIIERHGLTRFDVGATGPSDENNNNNDNNNSDESDNETPNPSSGTYTVVSGDTLNKLSSQFGTTVSAIKSANGLTSDLIRVGQTLTIPGQGNSGGSSNNGSDQSSNDSGSTSGGSYTVVGGDTLTGIANQFGTSTNALQSANNLSNADMIFVGQTLTIPGQGNSGGSSNSGSNQDSNDSGSASGGSYTVVGGDTLTGIANQFGTSTNALKSANNLSNADMIFVGQTLTIPGQGNSGGSSNNGSDQGSNDSGSTSGGSYTVVGGDTLTGIANQFGTSTNALQSANNLSNADMIFVGQTLTIPGQGNSGSSNSGSNESSSQTSQGSYTVVAGDTLTGIARENNTTVSSIQELNNLSGDMIYVGQTLNLDSNSSSNSNSSNNQSNGSNGSVPVNYTVKTGDTLYAISNRYGVSSSQLASWNNLSNEDVIYVDQTLTIRLNDNSSQSSSSETDSYVVQSGDTLTGIARQFDTTVQSLVNNNSLTSDLIFVGQTLNV